MSGKVDDVPAASVPTGPLVPLYNVLANCPAVATHTPQPSGYSEWIADCRRRYDRGEVREVCPTCGLYAIWRKPC